jgi:hypothetical protein
MSEILLTLALLSVLAFLYFYNKDIAKERQQLYDRLQAKDFVEYKSMTEPIEPKPKEEKRSDLVEL